MKDKKEKLHKRFEGKVPEDVREHAKSARAEMREGFKALFPPEVREHHRAAKREALQAMKKMVEHAIDKLEEK
jgi:glycerate-2-kinase